MILPKNIIKDDNPLLREKSTDVTIPLSEEDEKTLNEMIEYIFNSIDEEIAEKYNLRAAVGIAAPQIGILKKMIVIYTFDEDGNEWFLPIVNPKIVSYSDELTYLQTGEGCLSVDREVSGLIMRPKRTTFKGYIYDNGELVYKTIKLKNYLSVVFNHEYDHLRGILFPDHINQENPFFVPQNATPIKFETDNQGDLNEK